MKGVISSALAAFAIISSTTAVPPVNQEPRSLQKRNDAPPLPPCPPNDYQPFTYTGCYVQPNPETLQYNPNLVFSTMTVETCTATCKSNGFRYAGLIYYGNCLCGTMLPAVQAPDSECDTPCNGNPLEMCGGNNRYSIYQDNTYPAVDLTTISSQYVAKGCYSEGVGYRAVSYRQDALNFSTMTIETCLTACGNELYPLAGLEYYGECYCGYMLQGGSAQVADSNCAAPCNGNPSEICGGGGYLNLYEATILESTMPCSNAPPPPPPSTTSSTTTSSSPPPPPPPSTSSSIVPTTTPCARNVCFSTHFNSQSVPSGDIVWLSAVFKPKFSGPLAAVSFTNSRVLINTVQVSPTPPDSFIQLNSSMQSCGTVQFVSGAWQAAAPLPGSGNTFLSAVSIPVPSGINWASAQVTWCGDVTAPGEIDVQIAAAIYTSCSMSTANPEACETHTNYHAGVPTGCLHNLVAGGTGGGGSNWSGSLSATYPVCV